MFLNSDRKRLKTADLAFIREGFRADGHIPLGGYRAAFHRVVHTSSIVQHRAGFIPPPYLTGSSSQMPFFSA